MTLIKDLRKEGRGKRYEPGETKSSLYGIWRTMKQRCYNPNAHAYNEYGGRGILMCEEWSTDYMNFKEWAIQNGYENGLSVDRKDNNKGYCPENCRWATVKEQQRNRRDTRFATLQGETRSLAEWEEITGIGKRTLWNRLFILGWTDEKALTTPMRLIKRGNRL